jgi:hypothetical protein
MLAFDVYILPHLLEVASSSILISELVSKCTENCDVNLYVHGMVKKKAQKFGSVKWHTTYQFSWNAIVLHGLHVDFLMPTNVCFVSGCFDSDEPILHLKPYEIYIPRLLHC